MTQTIKLKRSATQGSAPSTSDLALGEVAINTYDGKMYIKKDDGTASIVEISGGGSGSAYTRYTYTATSSQTTFSVTYEVGFVDVWLNGVKLHSSDFTATNGSSVVLSSGATAGDLFEAIAWNAANVQQNAYGRTSYTATSGQTTFTATYTVGLVNVYMNGVLLLDGTEYTATNGTSIVLASGAATGDSIVIEAFNTFSVSTALAKANNLSDLPSASTAITNLGITATAAELNILDGVTATATELNVLDGVTATTTELNYVDGVTSNIQTQIDSINPSPTITATASGALANGDTVIVNSNGTVSAVSGSGANENLGTEQVLNSAVGFYTQCIYDTQNDKIIVFYRSSSNGDILGRVCTVSGDTITAGTEQTVYANNGTVSYMSFAYVGSGKFVFIANDGSVDGGVSAVGSVSGTTITVGSTVQFGDNSNNVRSVSVVYDENAGKVVAFWNQDASPNHSFAAVGTISGTSLSYGTPVQVSTQRGWFYPDSVVYDSTAQKVICCYMTFGGNEYGRARVGTVSGTSISFGTEVTFRSAIVDHLSATYDPDENKTLVFWRDTSNGYDLTASVLTVSGTSLTASTDVRIKELQCRDIASVYDTNANKTVVQYRDVESDNKTRILVLSLSGTTITTDSDLLATFEFDNGQPQIAFDPDQGRVILCGEDADNSTYPTAAALTVGYTNSNLTAENFIGFSNAAYSDGDTATIQIVGSVDDAQSSLTAGQTYYVSFDGSLVLTPITPSVTAGTAVSATKIIVKG